MAEQPQLVPLDGSLNVLPGFIDFHAKHNPTRAWAKFPSFSNPSEATSVSFGDFAKATHRIAHTLRPGRAGNDGEVVAVFIHCDTILYLALLAGLVRAGFVVWSYHIPFP